MGPIAGQQADAQQIANSLMATGVIPGTPTSTPNVNQIQGSLQGQMGSDFASTNGMNAPTSGAVMPPANAPTKEQQAIDALRAANIIPGGGTYNEQDVMNRIINMPEMPRINQNVTPNFQPNPSITTNPSTGLTGQEQQAISSLISAGVIPGTNASNVNVNQLQTTLAANNQAIPDYASSLNLNPSGAMPEMTNSQQAEAQVTRTLNSNPPGTITSLGGAGFYFMDENGKMYGGANEAEVMKLRDKMMPTYKK
jgi:hypothetical protein